MGLVICTHREEKIVGNAEGQIFLTEKGLINGPYI